MGPSPFLGGSIPHICHKPYEYIRVIFFRFNAKIWQFTVYFAVITQKIGNLLCILSLFTRFFGVNFILQKFCSCKKDYKYLVCLRRVGDGCSLLMEGFPTTSWAENLIGLTLEQCPTHLPWSP